MSDILGKKTIEQAKQEFANVYDLLESRGYLAQCNDVEGLKDHLSKPGAKFYIGFDPTADSLHIGHFIQVIIGLWMQAYGHHALFVAGGGTGLIGDPTGRQDLRKVLTKEQVERNVEDISKQLKQLMNPDNLTILNNADWLKEIGYIDYLREVGVHFTVNRMLSAECYKSRLDIGLTFLEFNYMTIQAYDFLHLFREYGCRVQFGGDDQWSNVLAGSELIRRVEGEQAYVQTFKLITTADGVKMGKTAAGAVWLDPKKFSPFELYQYFRNIDDQSVIEFMKLLTMLPLSEIEKYSSLEGSGLNAAKVRLALEVTTLIHGEEAALAAQKQAEELFHGKGSAAGMETLEITAEQADMSLLDLLAEAKFIPSKSEGRRLIKQNGLYLNEEPITDFNLGLGDIDFEQEVIIRRGKKNHLRLVKQ